MRCAWWLASFLVCALPGCTTPPRVLTFSGSVVGREAEVIRAQIARFAARHPSIPVVMRATPDAADQRRQLYVQWLNARASDPDVLQLDVVWTAEFAAAGWIRSLDENSPPVDDLFPAAVAAGRWRGTTYALPWFVDVGMLYRRSDLVQQAPGRLSDLVATAAQVSREQNVPFGWIWQGARYEGLVTVYLELLGGFGGRILGDDGAVEVDSPSAIRALTFMRDAMKRERAVPETVLTWQEEQTRYAFQNGQSVFMRNWPYAFALLQDPERSSVAGRVAVSSMPAADGGAATATLGGSMLAVNAHSEQPEAAYQLISFLLEPEQMLERARVAGQYPPRRALYQTPELASALTIPPAEALAIIERATPRPVTPVYNQLSEILQIALHRVLSGQQEPADGLRQAASDMRALLASVKLAPL